MNNTKLKEKLNGKIQAQQSEPSNEGIIDMPTETTELTTIEQTYFPLNPNVLDIFNENLKHQQLSPAMFDVVKAPSGGSTAFSVPGMSGDEVQKELPGIILDYATPTAYWDTPDPVEGTPPVCYSYDSITSHDGKPCSGCGFNTFGSKGRDGSNAKACKESVSIYLLRKDNIMPLIVRVPVSSKRTFQKYMTRLSGNRIPANGAVTKITLEKATSKTGQPYSLYIFEAIKLLTPEEAAGAKAFGQKFVELMTVAGTTVADTVVQDEAKAA
jgi:hypothetical protein